MGHFPEPTEAASSRTEVLLRYLDYFREAVVAKLEDLDDAELRLSRLPSDWTPIQLLKHLIFVERRWFVWGFEGRDVPDPWGDARDERWFVAPEESLADLIAALDDQSRETRAVATRHGLDARGAPGPRWDGAEPASLERVLLHVMQEYARHLGQLDVVRELIDGTVGE